MSELLDALTANSESICRALADSTADFICLATSHGEPFYLNPAGRRMVGLARTSRSARKPARLLCRRLVEGAARRGGAGGQSQRALGRPQPAPQPQDRRAAEPCETIMFRVKPPQSDKPTCLAIVHRDAGPRGPPPRGPGRVASPQARDPRIGAGPDHHHQPRGRDHRVQPGGGAGLRPSPRQGAGHAALGRPLPALEQRRPAEPHRPLPGGGRRARCSASGSR